MVALEAITHKKNEPREEYYKRIRENPLALEVKLADIADNSDESRLAVLDKATQERLRAKYKKAIELLTDNEKADTI